MLTAFFYLLLLYVSPDVNVQKEIFRKVSLTAQSRGYVIADAPIQNGLSREHDRRRRKRGEPPQKWMLPLGFMRWRPEVCASWFTSIWYQLTIVAQDGLHFLQIMKWGVLQYCVIRPTFVAAHYSTSYACLIRTIFRTTLAAVILDYAGLYCEDSWGPGWGHIYASHILLFAAP